MYIYDFTVYPITGYAPPMHNLEASLILALKHVGFVDTLKIEVFHCYSMQGSKFVLLPLKPDVSTHSE
jgi:hypothetical protein